MNRDVIRLLLEMNDDSTNYDDILSGSGSTDISDEDYEDYENSGMSDASEDTVSKFLML